MSPDGKLVLYSEGRLDWENNRFTQKAYLVPSQGGEPRPFLGSAGGADFKFSPDGKYVSLIREVGHELQIFLMPVSGGEAQQLTRLKGGVWSGERHRQPPAKRTYDLQVGSIRISDILCCRRTTRKRIHGQNGMGRIRSSWTKGLNGKSAGRWSNLWKIDLQSKRETKITDEQFIIQDFDVSPDGNRIVFSARRDNRINYPYLSELYMVDVRNPGLVRLTDNRAPEDSPTWSPDGKSIAYYGAF